MCVHVYSKAERVIPTAGFIAACKVKVRIAKMKTPLTLITCALLLMSNIAAAQENKEPSDKMDQGTTGQGTMDHGTMGQDTMDQDTMGHDMMGRCMGRGMMGRGMMGRSMMDHSMRMRIMMILLDTDNDGALSLEEVQTAHSRIFKAIDVNKDGKVTLEEMQVFFSGASPTSNQ
jgi:hypothetical protein